jgi:hypothetical protein
MATGAAAEPNQYLCVVERAAGLHYNERNEAYEGYLYWRERSSIMTLSKSLADL